MRTLLLIFSFLLVISCENNDDTVNTPLSCDYIDFKYYSGEEEYLGELSTSYILIGSETSFTDIEIQDFISTFSFFNQDYNYSIYSYPYYNYKVTPLKFNMSKSCEEITQLITELEQNAMVSYAHYTIITDNCLNDLGGSLGELCIDSYSSYFYVKVFDENNLTDLNETISQTNTEFVEQNQFMPKWFTLKATKISNGDALAMANYFHETGFFDSSEPDIVKYPVE